MAAPTNISIKYQKRKSVVFYVCIRSIGWLVQSTLESTSWNACSQEMENAQRQSNISVTKQTCEIARHLKPLVASIRVVRAHTPIVLHKFDSLWFSMAAVAAVAVAMMTFCRLFYYDDAPFFGSQTILWALFFLTVKKRSFSWCGLPFNFAYEWEMKHSFRFDWIAMFYQRFLSKKCRYENNKCRRRYGNRQHLVLPLIQHNCAVSSLFEIIDFSTERLQSMALLLWLCNMNSLLYATYQLCCSDAARQMPRHILYFGVLIWWIRRILTYFDASKLVFFEWIYFLFFAMKIFAIVSEPFDDYFLDIIYITYLYFQ